MDDTSSPRATSRRTTACPKNPPPPVTSTFISSHPCCKIVLNTVPIQPAAKYRQHIPTNRWQTRPLIPILGCWINSDTITHGSVCLHHAPGFQNGAAQPGAYQGRFPVVFSGRQNRCSGP